MGFASVEGAGAAPAPAGDAGPVARTGSDLYVNVHRNRGVGPGIFSVHAQGTVSGIAGDRHIAAVRKVVFCPGGGVGAQGHTQCQDKGQGNDTNVFLHGNQAFSHS